MQIADSRAADSAAIIELQSQQIARLQQVCGALQQQREADAWNMHQHLQQHRAAANQQACMEARLAVSESKAIVLTEQLMVTLAWAEYWLEWWLLGATQWGTAKQ
jgi:hypothetical protein